MYILEEYAHSLVICVQKLVYVGEDLVLAQQDRLSGFILLIILFTTFETVSGMCAVFNRFAALHL